MFRQTNSGFGGHRRNTGLSFRGRNRRYGGYAKGEAKKLDVNLFINKAQSILADTYNPEHKFSDFNISDAVKKNISAHGYVMPTEIQDKTIPVILEGRDVIGMANTGTGKTAAFLITLINKCLLSHQEKVLIVVPTRELALQIEDEFKIFAYGTGLKVVSVIGGANINTQMRNLKERPEFVIGTPGRLKDLVGRHVINLSYFNNIVLDEVDRMVDIGFVRDIKYLISLLPQRRQSLFFSATVDGKTREILGEFVNDPVTVSLRQQPTSITIEQDVIRISDRSTKLDILHDLLLKPGFDKVLVFGRTKWETERLSRALKERGFKVTAIHGNKTQGQRLKALQEFKDDKLQVLIATDVASRGLDINNVTHVINYDAPTSYEDYIHRIGRTGRAGKQGIALTFVE